MGNIKILQKKKRVTFFYFPIKKNSKLMPLIIIIISSGFGDSILILLSPYKEDPSLPLKYMTLHITYKLLLIWWSGLKFGNLFKPCQFRILAYYCTR